MESLTILMVSMLLSAFLPQLHGVPPMRGSRLSSIDHHPHGGGHDVRFDHEAFLGKADAAKFDNLTPEESEAKLSEIYKKVDASEDGIISKEEMADWVKRVHLKSIDFEGRKDFKEYGGVGDVITFDNYIKEAHHDDAHVHPDDLRMHLKQKEQTRERWTAADVNNDGNLSVQEFIAFRNPMDFDHMHKIHVQETIANFDSNEDGIVSVDEFIQNRRAGLKEDEATPEWITQEIETMTKFFDKNSDGLFDFDEMQSWLFPANHDPYNAETNHLFIHADENKDGQLTLDEVLKHHEIFVGSQMTAYGRILGFHEEL